MARYNCIFLVIVLALVANPLAAQRRRNKETVERNLTTTVLANQFQAELSIKENVKGNELAITYLDENADVKASLEDLDNYMNHCVDREQGPTSIPELLRETSSVCVDQELDGGTSDCENPVGQIRYGFSKSRNACVQFRYRGCGGNDNNFETIEECSQVCEDPCTLRPNRGARTEEHSISEDEIETVSCVNGSGTYYYYHGPSSSCRAFFYQGCGGNRNRFETEEQCKEICADDHSVIVSRVQAARRTASLSLPAEIKQETLDLVAPSKNQNEAEYCKRVEKAFPDMTQAVRSLSMTSAPSEEDTIVEELDKMISKGSSSDREAVGDLRSKRFILNTLFHRPLRHTTVKIFKRKSCRRVEVTIRIKCVRALIRRPTVEQANLMCNLIKQGIKKHWEVDILKSDGTVDYEVDVKVKESWLFSKKVMLQWFSSPPSNLNNVRSFNLGFPGFPMWMKYREMENIGIALQTILGYNSGSSENLSFMRTSAHEFGHDVLKAHGGVIWSWTHEGTSTLFQNTHSGTPPVPPNPQPVNLMWYHSGGDYTNYIERSKASQLQIKALVNRATFRFTIPWCPGAIGSPCLTNSHCNPPGICSWFRCVHCSQDQQCPSNKYCHGKFNPFIVNHCAPKKSNGKFCNRDAMCQSGYCDGGRCVECETDSHCPTGHYCRYNSIPLVLNQCVIKKPNGQFCLQDRQCQSNHCDGGQCVECEQDWHCSSNKYCKNKHLPLVLNFCTNKKPNGGWCLRDSECQSNKCHGARCVECEVNSHCPSDHYCKYKYVPFVQNRCVKKKCQGFCTSHEMCLSGHCRWYGFCKKC